MRLDESARFIESLLLTEEASLKKSVSSNPLDWRHERLAMVRRAFRWLERVERHEEQTAAGR